METRIVKDLQECKLLWNKYSPSDTIWNLWDTVTSFYDEKFYEPYFILFEDGLIPLWYDKKFKKYYFFGGEFPENRTLWIDINKFEEVIEQLPENTTIFDLNGTFVESIIAKNENLRKYFPEEDIRYFLNLKNFDFKLEEYLKTFNKKHRKNFLYDIKKLQNLNYELIWEEDEHFEEFVNFSVERFGVDSDLSDKQFKKEMNTFVTALKNRKMLHTLTIKINEKVEGIELAALFNGHYYVLNGGYNRKIKNLGKLLIFEHIKKALELKAKEIDFLVGDTGWKKLWNFETDKCYSFRKK
ncbi:MAG: GNAT family N-acetyltransferase [archaeon]